MVKARFFQVVGPSESTHAPELVQLLYAFEDHTQAFLREDQMQDSSVASEQCYGDLGSHTYGPECVAGRFATMEDWQG
jgi:hypothetical protein